MTLPASIVDDLDAHLERFAGDPYVLTAPRAKPTPLRSPNTRVVRESGFMKFGADCGE